MGIGLLLVGLVVLVLALALLGALYQAIATTIEQRRYPPPGKLVDLGGYQLHLNCMGKGQPTVVMDSGAGNSSLDWLLVQPEVAQFTRVCSYDRAGYGWSDPSLKPRTSQQSVDELHTLLVKSEIEPPYVLVGHSLGGMNVRLYASQYPDEVVGMVLVDAGHEELRAKLSQLMTPDARQGKVRKLMLYKLGQMVAPFGLLRLLGELGLVPQFQEVKKMLMNCIPEGKLIFNILKASWYRTHFLTALHSELTHLEESSAQVGAARSLLDMPLVVLTRGVQEPNPGRSNQQMKQFEQVWNELQADLVSLSSNSTQLIAQQSGHYIHLEQPQLVVKGIRQVVEAVRNR
ncbi:MAG: alpha/beta hydrolase [Chroococcidiopsidaceae cyanobacterium CP_BM_ER_R8_30]|nr:alpha/beta hydrolase [Chroococcidiopsidaceae cyanobacterium CP_BM_ER_R8_30]